MSTVQKASHLASYLEISAQAFPNRTAIVSADGQSLTYATLNVRANQVAHYLLNCGVQPNDRVGMLIPKGAEAVIILFGILKSGAAYVPVDPNAPMERSLTILQDSEISALFIDNHLTQVLPNLSVQNVVIVGQTLADDYEAHWTDWSVIESYPTTLLNPPERRSEDLAYILYTSGSTGKPKGVMLTHQNACSFVDWCSEVFSPTEHDRFSSHAPFHFDLSVFDLYVSIKHGAATYLLSAQVAQNPRQLPHFIEEHGITVWYSTPSILALMAEFGRLEQVKAASLRLILFAGEVFPVKHLRELSKRWPHPAYYNLYGPTETNVCTFAQIHLPIPEERVEPYPIGFPCSHCRSLVLDGNQQPVLDGQEGLLYIAGPSLFSGYWKRPEASVGRFIKRDGDRWYNTGDIVRTDPTEGYIYVRRQDRMVKRHGYRIELGEIENALYRHKDVRESAVIADVQVEGVQIIAYLSLCSQNRPSIVEMRMFCQSLLPIYMIPDRFVFIDDLPRTSTDKVNYPALYQLVA
jgi:amino acid adenylation domain-containing protein